MRSSESLPLCSGRGREKEGVREVTKSFVSFQSKMLIGASTKVLDKCNESFRGLAPRWALRS